MLLHISPRHLAGGNNERKVDHARPPSARRLLHQLLRCPRRPRGDRLSHKAATKATELSGAELTFAFEVMDFWDTGRLSQMITVSFPQLGVTFLVADEDNTPLYIDPTRTYRGCKLILVSEIFTNKAAKLCYDTMAILAEASI
jgi:hypothetical protein